MAVLFLNVAMIRAPREPGLWSGVVGCQNTWRPRFVRIHARTLRPAAAAVKGQVSSSCNQRSGRANSLHDMDRSNRTCRDPLGCTGGAIYWPRWALASAQRSPLTDCRIALGAGM